MTFRTLAYIMGNLLAIIACGAIGAGAGYALLALLGLWGVAGALLAAFVGMVVATAAWALGSSLLRAAGVIR
jgi:hypothetical protein